MHDLKSPNGIMFSYFDEGGSEPCRTAILWDTYGQIFLILAVSANFRL